MHTVDRNDRNALTVKVDAHDLLHERRYKENLGGAFHQHYLSREEQAGLGSVEITLKVRNVFLGEVCIRCERRGEGRASSRVGQENKGIQRRLGGDVDTVGGEDRLKWQGTTCFQ